jgi:hypothetical protein
VPSTISKTSFGKGFAPNHLPITAIYRDKPPANSLPVYIGEFGMALGRAPHPQPITPPDSFSELVAEGTWSERLHKIGSSSTTHGERKELVQAIRSLAEQCAFEQRSNAEVVLERQLKDGEWNSVHGDLPATYEDVRILVDGVVRIARLGHNRQSFQYAHYCGNAKHQYGVMLEHVQDWQLLLGVPSKPLEATA